MMTNNKNMESVDDVQVQVVADGRTTTRRRRRGATPPAAQGGKSTESLWENAVNVDANNDGVIILQLVGLLSPTRTVFARMIIKASIIHDGDEPCQNQNHLDQDNYQAKESCVSRSTSLGHVVQLVLDKARQTQGATTPDSETNSRSLQVQYYSGSELFELGSVWLLGEPQPETAKNTRKGSNRNETSSWHRLALHDRDRIPTIDWSCLTLRIHCRPTRFSTCGKVRVDAMILHQNAELGFAIWNKPGGVPSHATVDNGVENALSMFFANHYRIIREDVDGDDEPYYATLPQRLDTETWGLLVIATRKEFASYMSRLLESKTTRHVVDDNGGQEQQPPPTASVDNRVETTITKKYRCLVGVETKDKQRELCRFQTSHTVLTHYLDAQSSAPKTFLSTPPLQDDEDETTTPINTESKKRWLKCQLLITNVGEALCVLEQGDSSTEGSRTLARDLWAHQGAKPAAFAYVVTVEVELLTGRTHQIRGQLGALGCPIVGDPLYGGGGDIIGNKRNSNAMALQCCAITFPHPEWNVVAKKGKGKRLVASSATQCAFHLEQAWWTRHIEESAPASYKF